MAAQKLDPTTLQNLQRRGTVSALGYEAVDITAGNAVPTRTDPYGNAWIPVGLLVGVAGNVIVDGPDGASTQVTLPLPAGVFSGCITKIYKTGTTATGLVWLY